MVARVGVLVVHVFVPLRRRRRGSCYRRRRPRLRRRRHEGSELDEHVLCGACVLFSRKTAHMSLYFHFSDPTKILGIFFPGNYFFHASLTQA